jgi:hypothetical protein
VKRPDDAIREEWDEQVYAPDPREVEASPGWVAFFLLLLLVITGTLFWLFPPVSVAKAGEFMRGEIAQPELCRGYIDLSCSCSHRACWEPKPGEFVDMNNGSWREAASGVVKLQTGDSKDGALVACAWREGEGAVAYHVGRGNPLRCIYAPPKSF